MSCSKRLGPRETQYANTERWREREQSSDRPLSYLSFVSKVISLNSTIKSRWKSEGVRKCIMYTASQPHTTQVTVLGPHRHIVFSVYNALSIPKGRPFNNNSSKTLSPSRLGMGITRNLRVSMCSDFSLLTRDRGT